MTIIGTVAVLVIIVLCLGFFCELGIGRPVRDSTGGRSMFGISNPDALLDPIRRPSERRGK